MTTIGMVAIASVLAVALAWLFARNLRRDAGRRVLNESITNNMPSGVITVDERGIITSHNPAGQRIFGYDLGTGVAMADLVVEGPRLAQLLREVVASGETFSRETFHVAAPQTGVRVIGMSISPINGLGHRTAGALCILTDLTEVVRLQEQLRLKENFAALGEMSAGIAHEFKNSLTAISGYAQMLETESDPERAANYVREIVTDTRALARVVSEFLQFARPVEVGLEPVELGGFLTDTLDELRKLRPGEYAIDFAPPEAAMIVGADRTLLRQALLNVLINAVESFPASTPEADRAIQVSVECSGDAEAAPVRIAVRDRGMGIDAKTRDKVMIPFFTTKSGGTGLGLPLVQKIALAHNGVFELSSEPGIGTVAAIVLPAGAFQEEDVAVGGLRPQ